MIVYVFYPCTFGLFPSYGWFWLLQPNFCVQSCSGMCANMSFHFSTRNIHTYLCSCNSMFSLINFFLELLHHFIPHEQCMRNSVSPHLCQHLVFSPLFNFMHSERLVVMSHQDLCLHFSNDCCSKDSQRY